MDEGLSTHVDPAGLSDSIAQDVVQPVDALVVTKWRQRNQQLLAQLLPCNNDSADRASFTRTLPSDSNESDGRARMAPFRPQRSGAYLLKPVQIKSDTVEKLLSHVTHSTVLRESIRNRPIPMVLPQELNVPHALRCVFCQKFDSLCSTCLRKWRETLRRRRRGVACQVYCRLPEEQRRALLLMTAAYGTGDFAAMQLDFDADKCLQWQSPFYPLPEVAKGGSAATSALHAAFDASGDVGAIHVAFAYSRVDVVAALLAAPCCLLSKSSRGIDPVVFLAQPLPSDMEDVLGNFSVFTEHLLAEVAKQLRRRKDWDGAKRLYAEFLEMRPDSEYAHSGLAKMCYDQGLVQECIHQCDALISGATPVAWNEISPSTIQVLRNLAVTRHHDYCHSIVGGPVLKACGCIILDRVRVPVRRLPFGILIDHIFAFCDGKMLWTIFHCTRMPLLRSVTEKLAVLLPPQFMQDVLECQPGFHAMLSQLTEQFPHDAAALVSPPVRPLGVRVVAMADFNMFLIKAYAAGAPPKTNKTGSLTGRSFFKFGRKAQLGNSVEAPELFISKEYRIDRARMDDPWRVKETGEWEAEHLSSEAVEALLRN